MGWKRHLLSSGRTKLLWRLRRSLRGFSSRMLWTAAAGVLVEWRAATFLFEDRGKACMVGGPEGCFRLVSVRDEGVSVFAPRPRRASLVAQLPIRIGWDRRRQVCEFYEGILYDGLSGCLVVRGESLSLILAACYVAIRFATGDMDPRFARDNFLGLFSKVAAECARGEGITSGSPGPCHAEIASALES